MSKLHSALSGVQSCPIASRVSIPGLHLRFATPHAKKASHLHPHIAHHTRVYQLLCTTTAPPVVSLYICQILSYDVVTYMAACVPSCGRFWIGRPRSSSRWRVPRPMACWPAGLLACWPAVRPSGRPAVRPLVCPHAPERQSVDMWLRLRIPKHPSTCDSDCVA